MEDKTKPVQIPIKADDAVQAGAFANLARISHDAEAFLLDFVVIHSSPPFGRLVSRVILTPGHAKRLAEALAENIHSFERSWGPIRAVTPPPTDLGHIQ